MPNTPATECHSALVHFQEPLRRWFGDTFDAPTAVQAEAWPLIAEGQNTLLLAPTGSGKTLAAFLVDGETLNLMERHLLSAVLQHTAGNKLRAAKILGVTRSTLRNKMNTLGISINQSVSSDE